MSLQLPDGRYYWEIIADNLHKAGWSYGYVGVVTEDGRCLWVVDAHREGVRHVVRADDKFVAFQELEAATRPKC